MLVARGHTLNDVLHHYNLNQLHAFAAASEKNRARHLADLAVCMRAAMSADEKDFTRFINILQSGPSAGKPAADKVITSDEVYKLVLARRRKKGKG